MMSVRSQNLNLWRIVQLLTDHAGVVQQERVGIGEHPLRNEKREPVGPGADGRRRKRKRDETPDAAGLSIKHSLLSRVIHDDVRDVGIAGGRGGHGEKRARGVAAGPFIAGVQELAPARSLSDDAFG